MVTGLLVDDVSSKMSSSVGHVAVRRMRHARFPCLDELSETVIFVEENDEKNEGRASRRRSASLL